MRILTVNVGSTSVKVSVVRDGATLATHDDLDLALAEAGPVDAVAHRIVHGGTRPGAAVVDDALVDELTALSELAPLHQPGCLAALDRTRAALPSTVHVACFDTAFHSTVPPSASTYAIPRELGARVRAYGFHGLSHRWAARQVAAAAPSARRLVVAHLGGGQSLCAVRDGCSVATTMGFTPLDGLVMGTRSGAIDPGAVLWLQQRVPDLEDVLVHRSGLLGLCGSSDMREVQRRRAAGDADAALAFDVWLHRTVSLLGGCIAVLGGLDALAFTGGIGEHDQAARAAVLGSLAWIGVAGPAGHRVLDEGLVELTAPGDTVRTFVVASREDLQMADEAAAALDGGA